MKSVPPRSICLFLALVLSQLLCADLYVIRVTSPTTLALPAPKTGKEDFYQCEEGAWQPLATEATETGRRVSVSPKMTGPSGKVKLLLGKPSWMLLDDSQPPSLQAITCGGKQHALAKDGTLTLTATEGASFSLRFHVSDAKNPVDPSFVSFVFSTPVRRAVVPVLKGLDGLSKEGWIEVMLANLEVGRYEGVLRVSDRSAAQNTLDVPVRIHVVGVSVSEDRQTVRLVNQAAEFVFQPHLSQQLLLPDGQWAKLTTNMRGVWLYPREFTEVKVTRPDAHSQTAIVRAKVQGIKGKPVNGLGELVFELTVRDDSNALFVRSRSVNITEESVSCNANWGWLSASSYTLPEGAREWRGKSHDAYIGIGKKDWLWLAPTKKGAKGLVWISEQVFGESRFDTMLLYSKKGTCAKGQSADLQFAIASARDAEEACGIFEKLKELGCLGKDEE